MIDVHGGAGRCWCKDFSGMEGAYRPLLEWKMPIDLS